MSGKRPSVYLSQESLEFLEYRGESLSGAINRTIDRYAQLIKNIQLPIFSESEIFTLLNATNGVIFQPAEMIAGLWQGIQDDLVDDLSGKVSKEDQDLIDKLKNLTYPQEVVLLERLEQRRAYRK